MEPENIKGCPGKSKTDTCHKDDDKKGGVDQSRRGATVTEHVDWALEKLAKKEKITMPGFAKDFGYYSEQDAHSAFIRLLSSSNIPQSTGLRLQEKYLEWRNNLAERYWADRVTSSQVTISLKRTAGEIAAGSERIAKKIIQEEASSIERSLEGFDNDNSSDLQTIDRSLPFIGTPSTALNDTIQLPSSQSLFAPRNLSPEPPEEYLIANERYILDLRELTGNMFVEQETKVYTLDNYLCLEERWDRRLNEDGLERPDVVISHHGVVV
ncbi:hypothetical protein BGW38_005978, partial [Lunasporangiospora selenospora]